MKIKVLKEINTLTCKTHVRVTIIMNIWDDPTVLTNILPQTVPNKTTITIEFGMNVFKHVNWEIGKMDLATKSRPPDCGITSVSSREYVCWQFQAIEPEDFPKIYAKCMNTHKNPYLEVSGRGGSLQIIDGHKHRTATSSGKCYAPHSHLLKTSSKNLLQEESVKARLQHSRLTQRGFPALCARICVNM